VGLIRTQSREKYTAKPVQFGATPALFAFFGERFCFPSGPNSFRGTIRKVQNFSL